MCCSSEWLGADCMLSENFFYLAIAEESHDAELSELWLTVLLHLGISSLLLVPENRMPCILVHDNNVALTLITACKASIIWDKFIL